MSVSATSISMNNVSNPLMGLEQTVGSKMLQKIQSCKLLVVGSGGIGCELLKNLSLSGFRQVQVIDLDTIDVSNLNRQLLFRSQHVGSPKCTVACQVAAEMVPTSSTSSTSSSEEDTLPPIQYQAHHGNVCDTSKFNVPFLEEFDLVLNALDNVEARRRVNRLCLAADTPLVEAGTTGYLGQTTVIHKSSEVACYECNTQETQKVYPICTIRSTPSMPVHTIVWAKELYKLLFHSKVEDSMLYEDPEGEEPSTYMDSVSKVRELLMKKDAASASASELTVLVGDLLGELYGAEIQKQLDMDRYKAAKKTPTVLDPNILKEGLSTKSEYTPETAIWTLGQCVGQLRDCLVQASQTLASGGTVLEEFDKDDDLAMRLVCASSNLRSSIFGITPLQSLYSAKGIAGNIIPAIATTNAICAGLQILECFQILQQQLLLEEQGKDKKKDLRLKESCCYVNCLRNKVCVVLCRSLVSSRLVSSLQTLRGMETHAMSQFCSSKMTTTHQTLLDYFLLLLVSTAVRRHAMACS
jgi:ubiquitin-like 1-activating enzyme E1 B